MKRSEYLVYRGNALFVEAGSRFHEPTGQSGLGYLLMSRVDAVWQLYLFNSLMVGIRVSGTDVVLLSTIARWFVRRRGTMR